MMENRETDSQSLTLLPRVELAVRSPMEALAAMSDAEFRARLDALKKAQTRMATIQREMMKEGVDYGVIPGTGDKPTLLKPGSEVLCNFHHLRPTFVFASTCGDGMSSPTIRVEAICSLHVEDEQGPVVGQGVGACNSWEKKYRWRDAQRTCPRCGAAAIIKGKEQYGGGWLCWPKKGGCGAKFKDGDPSIEQQQIGQVENADPFDLENTIKKMAAKRAQVDATLRTTATSGLFTQDVEDMDLGPAPAGKPAAAEKPAREPRPEANDWPPSEEDAMAPEEPEDVPPPPRAQNGTKAEALARYHKLCSEAADYNAAIGPRDQRISFGLLDESASLGEIISAGKSLKAKLEAIKAPA